MKRIFKKALPTPHKNLRLALLVGSFAGFIAAGCNPTTSTSGNSDPGNRGRVAASNYSTITGTAGTSITAGSAVVNLRSREGGPIKDVVPTITMTPAHSQDSFSCGATNASGIANCVVRSVDAGVAKTLQITSPVSKSATSTITFTQAASALAFATNRDVGGADLAGSAVARVDFAVGDQPLVNIVDPLGNTVTASTQTITVSVVPVLAATSGTPTIYKAGVACGTTCTFTAIAGQIDFSLPANLIALNLAGTFKLSFSGTGLTSLTSTGIFTVTPGAAAAVQFSQQPDTAATVNEVLSPQPIAKIVDQDGNTVTSSVANIAMSLNSPVTGTHALLGTSTIPAANGVSDFVDSGLRIDSNTGGSFTLTASSAGLTSATSVAIAISRSGIPSKIEFSTQPAAQTVNDDLLLTPELLPRQPVVRILDDSNNLVTGISPGLVTLSLVGCSAAGGTNLLGTSTGTPVGGVLTFTNLRLSLVDPLQAPAACQLVASFTYATITYTRTSNVVQILAPGTTPYKLAWTKQPSTAGINQAIRGIAPVASITVTVQDAAGSTVSSDNSTTVVLSKLIGPGTLGGVVTATAVNGIATFEAPTLNAVGTHQLRASSTGLVAADSNAFFISNAQVATRLKWDSAVTLTPQTAGVAWDEDADPTNATRLLEIQVVDDFGAIVTSANNVNIDLTCSSPASCSLQGATRLIAINGIATITDANGLFLTTPVGPNVALTATASGYTSAQTPFAINVAAGAVTDVSSSISATCPTTNDNTPAGSQVILFIKDAFGNPLIGQSITALTYGGTAGASCVTSTLTPSDSAGRIVGTFQCMNLGTVVVGATVGALGTFTQTYTCIVD